MCYLESYTHSVGGISMVPVWEECCASYYTAAILALSCYFILLS